jgi:hypothetical protein
MFSLFIQKFCILCDKNYSEDVMTGIPTDVKLVYTNALAAASINPNQQQKNQDGSRSISPHRPATFQTNVPHTRALCILCDKNYSEDVMTGIPTDVKLLCRMQGVKGTQ